jgi:TetR/AcrR family transcriptional regulator
MEKPPKATSARNPERTRTRILDAAKAEFAALGYAGARVDRIAAAAGVNKRMLYHYFGNKRDLYREVYERQVVAHGARVDANPADPIDALPYWYDEVSRDVEWTRLLGWEALTEESLGSVGAAALRRNYDGAVGWVKDAQARGLISAELDPELYLLMTIAVNMFPLGFPQVTRSVTGLDPTDEAFRERQRRFLVEFGKHLRPGGGGRASSAGRGR